MFDAVRVVDRCSAKSVHTVAAWNIQRGIHVGDVARKLMAVQASVALLSECDVGMARSGNRDTVAGIADELGMAHAFAVEFEEQTLGNEDERHRLVGLKNTDALHGNAVLSASSITAASRIALDDGGLWEADYQARIGGRIALACRIGDVWFVSAHFDSRGGPGNRAAEMERLVKGLNGLGAARCVVGGDFNTKTDQEPLFDVAGREFFGFSAANVEGGRFEGRKFDWFFYRGVDVRCPQIYDASGISDHDLITVEVLT